MFAMWCVIVVPAPNGRPHLPVQADRILKKALSADSRDDQLAALNYYKSAVDLYSLAMRLEQDIKVRHARAARARAPCTAWSDRQLLSARYPACYDPHWIPPPPAPLPPRTRPRPPPPTPQAHNEVSTFSKVSPAESDRFIASYQARITKHDARRKVLRRLEMKGELLTPTVQEE